MVYGDPRVTYTEYNIYINIYTAHLQRAQLSVVQGQQSVVKAICLLLLVELLTRNLHNPQISLVLVLLTPPEHGWIRLVLVPLAPPTMNSTLR